jgi:dephospho-CoA kinase
MTLFIIVGMPASGKNIAREYAESKGIPYFATGDVVRAEVRRRGLNPDAQNTALVSTELRGDDGLGVTRHSLTHALQTDNPVIFMEGMRSLPEIELIRERTVCVVIAFLAPRVERLHRIVSRGRPDDSPDAFQERDMREVAYGTAAPIALADEYILNTGTPEEALMSLHAIVSRYAGTDCT